VCDPACPRVPGDGTARGLCGDVTSGPSDNWITPDGAYLYQIYGNAAKLVGYATQPDGSLNEITSVKIPYNQSAGLGGVLISLDSGAFATDAPPTRRVGGTRCSTLHPRPDRAEMPNSLAPKLVAEFIATFALVFIGAGAAAVVGNGAGLSGTAASAFATGLTIMVFVYAYGTVSGAHMNPAVTVGVLAVGAMSPVDAVGYIVAQVVGAVAAALALSAVLGGVATGLGTPALAPTWRSAP